MIKKINPKPDHCEIKPGNIPKVLYSLNLLEVAKLRFKGPIYQNETDQLSVSASGIAIATLAAPTSSPTYHRFVKAYQDVFMR
jgi:hypothetical protein